MLLSSLVVLLPLLVAGKVIKVDLHSCSANCDTACAECLASGYGEAVKCLEASLTKGCGAEVLVTESWNVTHFCLISDGDRAGWAFPAPLAAALIPDQLQSIALEGQVHPTTGPYDVFREDELEVSVSMEADKSTTTQGAMKRICAIKQPASVTGKLRSHHTAPPECLASPAPATCEYQPRFVRIEINGPLPGQTPIFQSELVCRILADAPKLSGNPSLGRSNVPPSLEKAVFTIVHKVKVAN